jgi:alanyl-tRNA synthetase
MNGNTIRRRFLDYFTSRGHEEVASSSLVPAEDPTLLFVNAGMNQFKDVFRGTDKRAYSRAATSQKCVRAGGKHNDLDNVGHTRRHLTFFEMLGNFSFGDYFKKEAIDYAWELITKDFDLPVDRLWVTVFREDDEAETLWRDGALVARERILRLDEKDNFWQMGDTGPCGPCSEIHFDLGAGASELGHANCSFPCECGRYIEIWNLVFMQFDRDETGRFSPLPRPSIDTGMGLERIASVLQGKLSVFETDLLMPIIRSASEIFGVEYGRKEATDVSLRIIADHIRAATFLISDGIVPSNEGRGYVLRKIMRRGIRQGTLLGRQEPFLHTVSGHVVDLMKEVWPDLGHTRDYVARVVESEEKRFAATVRIALEKLEAIADETLRRGSGVISGPDIFRLYDTFGLPLDFTWEIARERGLRLDEAGFQAELSRQKERARASWKGENRSAGAYESFRSGAHSTFLGYDTLQSTSRVHALILAGKAVGTISGEGVEAEVILDATPFYAEAGGQVGDTGTLGGANFGTRVRDTTAPAPGLIVHRVRLDFGELRVGDTIEARVDGARRTRIAANHTGTHLLHAALREVLGLHVKQKGSLVAPDRLRFDYTHYARLSHDEIRAIERRINQVILENHTVRTAEMDLDRAVEAGAIAFFEEKYEQRVRVVSVGDVSMELCGGTHTRATGDIGLFKVVSEGSVAAGIRRIEALTGFGSYERLESDESLLESLSGLLRTSRADLRPTIERLLETQRKLESEVTGLKRASASSSVDALLLSRRSVNDVPVVSSRVDDLDATTMRELAEVVRSRLGSGVVVLGSSSEGKAMLVTAVSSDLEKRLPAGKIVRAAAAIVGGSGGGRADFAQAGGKDPEKLDQALEEVYNIVAGLSA